jgi:predicted nucleotidyltransferase
MTNDPPSIPDGSDAPAKGLEQGQSKHWFTKPLSQEAVMAEVVPELTRRIVAAVHPLRIVLFGSAARGEMGSDSDLDVLVVVANGVDTNQASKDIYRGLRGLCFATDVLVIRVGDLLMHGDDPGMVYCQALMEGRELYCASK